MALGKEWRTSSRSGTNGQCVEVRLMDGCVEVRDSKDRAGGYQRYTGTEWRAFLDDVKAGEFDL